MSEHWRSPARAGSWALAAAALLAALPASGRGAPHAAAENFYELAPNAGRDAYRQIVQNHCVVNWLQHHDPSPCARIFLSDSQADSPGYAILEHPDGGAHYLLIPTQTLSGTDGTELLDPNLPNYFAEAWRARDLLAKFVGHEVPAVDVGLVVGTAATRTQNQFHIHIECLRPEVAESLKSAANRLGESWSALTVGGIPLEARSLSLQGLEVSNPFELVAEMSEDARHRLGSYTVVLAGIQSRSGPGFALLAGNGASGDLLLDSSCSVAGGGG